ncbi:hypothetical protein JRQ81_016599 [Phrynocephalus forsythii]|uniref:H/ACA ribonucleoprotein complex non-core subunit NAF1 n=1 Tax=Phrynocephalus forsythii TaxID=171643 RepID=A0A9Q1B1L9_9SAUR|nr:hypothetical protein JRQ81_016599 [Phrynocephalus forsythii]
MEATPEPAVEKEDSGLAGLRVAEHLQALTVACEGACGEAAEGGSSWGPEGRPAAVSPSEGLPGLTEPAFLRRGDAGGGDAALEEEPPPVGDGASSSSSSPRGGTPPNLNSGAGGEAVPGDAEASPAKPSSGGGSPEELPPAPDIQSGSSPLLGLGLGRGPTQGDPPGEPASPAKESPSGVPAAETVEGSDGGTASSSESESESNPNPTGQVDKAAPPSTEQNQSIPSTKVPISVTNDTDTDSSSSVSSSSSSCLPSLSEDDEQQCKNEKNSCSTRKKGESTEKELPNIEELSIILPESVELLPFGKVSSIIEHQVIIESDKGLPPVNEDTVFFKEDHHSIGKVFEVFGPVSHPFYVLQFNSSEQIESRGIKVHDAVYFAPSVESFTQYIFPEKLKQERGSDASWKNDEEPPPEANFSDDEKERAAKQQKKSQNVRRKKFKQEYSENGYNCQPRQQQPSDYFGGYCRGEPNPRFSRGRFPQSSVPPRFFRQPTRTPQHYRDYAEPKEPSSFYQQQRQDNLWRHPYSFPPPSFETATHGANFPPPPPPVTWGWPRGSSQNIYDPLLSLLSLPPPPPPPLPPPSAATSKSVNPP